MSSYDHVSRIVSRVHNARYDDIVTHLEELIDSGDWMDFTTPVGTHFAFGACEFDYFLAAESLDPLIIRHAYTGAMLDGMPAKVMRLADITGQGRAPKKGERRPVKEVAELYAAAPGGAGERIRRWGKVITERTGRVAKDEKLRRAFVKGAKAVRTSGRKRWVVEWSDSKTPAEAIVKKLLEDEVLEAAVYKRLHSRRVVNSRRQKRRSEAQ